MLTCKQCLQTRRRSFFADGVCEECDPSAIPPESTAREGHRLEQVLRATIAYTDPWVTEAEARDKKKVASWQWVKSGIGTYSLRVDPSDDRVQACLNWLEILLLVPDEDVSDYLCSIAMLGRVGWVTHEQFGLAASIWHAYQKEMRRGQETEAAVTPPSHPVSGAWLGVVGERVVIAGCQCTEARPLGVNEEHPEWGESWLIKFTSASGHQLVWFASEGGKFGPEVGGTYNVKATVKKHEEYQGHRTTIITRCADADAPPTKRKKKEE